MRTVRRLVLAVVLVALVVGLAGCSCVAQQIGKAAVEGATGVKVDQNGNGGVKVQGPNGQTISTGDNKLPDGLPDTVPAYQGTISAPTKVDVAEGTTYNFVITTTDDSAKVASWYKDQLTSKGWTIAGTVTTGDQAMVSAKQGDKNQVLVTIGKDSSSGQTQITTTAEFKK